MCSVLLKKGRRREKREYQEQWGRGGEGRGGEGRAYSFSPFGTNILQQEEGAGFSLDTTLYNGTQNMLKSNLVTYR